jgi:hypothetical protein
MDSMMRTHIRVGEGVKYRRNLDRQWDESRIVAMVVSKTPRMSYYAATHPSGGGIEMDTAPIAFFQENRVAFKLANGETITSGQVSSFVK